MFEVELIGWTAPKREVWEMGAGEVLDEAARLKASGGQAVGSISALSRLYLGCISARPRLYLGCISAIPRLYLGCISATPRLASALPHLTSPHLTSPRLKAFGAKDYRGALAAYRAAARLLLDEARDSAEIPPRFRRDSAEIRRDSPHRAAARLLPDDAPAEVHAWVSWASWGGL